MVEFLNKDAAYAKIVEIVSKAEKDLVLITPYIKIPDDLFERLKFMDGKGIKTTVVCREKNLKPEVKQTLTQLKNLDLRYDKDLHAKCFINEHSMVITSLNLYEHSQLHNREMGILLTFDKDREVYKEALKEAEFIVSMAKQDPVIGKTVRGIKKEVKTANSQQSGKSSRKATSKPTIQNGHCIRCGDIIDADPSHPYCRDCYTTWNKYKDPDYEEEFCHICGKPNETTTLNKPVCYSCYKKLVGK